MENSTKVPSWFTVIAVLAIIWNLLGVMAYLGQAYMTPEMMQSLPQDQQDAYLGRPAWATAVFALAVFGGLLGSLFLALRKRIAKPLLWISLVCIILNDTYNFIFIDSISLFGITALVMQAVVVLFAIYLIMLYKKAKSKSWIV